MQERVLEKEESLRRIDGKELAIGIQFSAQVGPNRQIVLTSGVPMDITPTQLNEYVDKMAYIMDRQNWKSELDLKRFELENREKERMTNREQLLDHHESAVAAWERSGKRGPFRMNDAQQKHDANLNNSFTHLDNVVIPKLKAQIKELEAKIEGD
jgi:hypothetical protein